MDAFEVGDPVHELREVLSELRRHGLAGTPLFGAATELLDEIFLADHARQLRVTVLLSACHELIRTSATLAGARR